MKDIIAKIDHQRILWFIGLILMSGVFFYFQPRYFPSTMTTILGLCFLPLIGQRAERGHKYLYLFLAILFFVLNGQGTGTLYYFSFIFSVLFWFEHTRYKLNWLPVFMLLTIAPIFETMMFLWSFPIRLEMSALVGKVLNSIGYVASVSGNVINLNGVDFSVDPACTGLKMMTMTIILSLLVLGYNEKQSNKRFGFLSIGIFLMIALLLAVVANFNRMLALVIFHVLPDNFMHDVIGLFSLILYVLAPIYFLGKPYAKKFAKEYFEINPKANNRVYLQLLMPLMLLVGLLFYAGPTTNEPERNIDERLSAVQLSGFETETLPTGIVKLKNEEALIYLKPPVTGFGTTHDPRYCWNGDGYKFSHIHEVEIAGVTVYAAELNKENTKLYTLWWYDNGKEKTIQEWNWRWKSITSRRSGFSLVNITMMEEDLLHETAEQILKEKKYSSFIR